MLDLLSILCYNRIEKYERIILCQLIMTALNF
nr:MAG TPA: hypothetical protein [Caudoviricetes sp.]